MSYRKEFFSFFKGSVSKVYGMGKGVIKTIEINKIGRNTVNREVGEYLQLFKGGVI